MSHLYDRLPKAVRSLAESRWLPLVVTVPTLAGALILGESLHEWERSEFARAERPGSELMAVTMSRYPAMVKGSGLLIALLLGACVRLTQGALARSREEAARSAELEREIGDRQRAEAELEKLGELHRAILDHATISIISTTPEGVITSFNPAAEHMLGYRADEVVGRLTPETIHDPREVAARAESFGRELGREIEPGFEVIVAKAREGLPNQHEWTYVRRDGSRLPVSLEIIALRDPDGAITGFLGIATDISELKREVAERERAEEELRLTQFAADRASDNLFRAGADGRLTYANMATCATLDRSEKELLASRVTDLLVDFGDWGEFWEGMKKRRHRIFESALAVRDGHALPAEITAAYVDYGDHELVCFTAKDITDRRRVLDSLSTARDAALESVRLKSEFLANMSHEIRTPMNGVIGMAELLARTRLTREQREYSDTIRRSAEMLLNLINDILDTSKIESGKLVLESVDFDLDEVIDATVDMVRGGADAKGLELTAFLPADVPTGLRGDPGRLQQILTNLAGNAVKFTDTGEVALGVTLLSESEHEVWIEIVVRDTGIGMPESALETIFEPFTQADGSNTRRHGGTGLGLSICRQLVEAMGGRIDVESTPGRGSRFRITASFARQASGSEDRAGANPLAGHAVLVVDDNASNRRLLEHQLAELGIRARCVASGVEALEALRQAVEAREPFDLALLDMQMPGMDGLELAGAIRFDPALAALRLVILSSLGDQPDTKVLREAGVETYLLKPVRRHRLRSILGEVLTSERPEPRGTSRMAPNVEREGPSPSTRILIAEDNEVNQRVLSLQLESLGYHADIVSNGRDAVRALVESDYDLVFMDCQMPEMDGFEATHEIRRNHRGAVRIIAMTASAMPGDRERCLEAGMDGYLSKPVTATDLERVVSDPHAGQGAGEDPDTGEAPPVDHRRLDEITGGHERIHAEIVTDYLEQADEVMAEIRRALDADDREALRRHAHKLCGSSGSCGMAAVVSPLRRLELSADSGDSESHERAFEECLRQLKRVREHLAGSRGGRPEPGPSLS